MSKLEKTLKQTSKSFSSFHSLFKAQHYPCQDSKRKSACDTWVFMPTGKDSLLATDQQLMDCPCRYFQRRTTAEDLSFWEVSPDVLLNCLKNEEVFSPLLPFFHCPANSEQVLYQALFTMARRRPRVVKGYPKPQYLQPSQKEALEQLYFWEYMKSYFLPEELTFLRWSRIQGRWGSRESGGKQGLEVTSPAVFLFMDSQLSMSLSRSSLKNSVEAFQSFINRAYNREQALIMWSQRPLFITQGKQKLSSFEEILPVSEMEKLLTCLGLAQDWLHGE